MEIEAGQPEEFTLCPWKLVDELTLNVEVCILMKGHEGKHEYRPTMHKPVDS